MASRWRRRGRFRLIREWRHHSPGRPPALGCTPKARGRPTRPGASPRDAFEKDGFLSWQPGLSRHRPVCCGPVRARSARSLPSRDPARSVCRSGTELRPGRAWPNDLDHRTRREKARGHLSTNASRQALGIPGKPPYSLMNFMAGRGFGVFDLDVKGFGYGQSRRDRRTTATADVRHRTTEGSAGESRPGPRSLSVDPNPGRLRSFRQSH